MRIFLCLFLFISIPLEALAFECHEHVKFGIPSDADQLLCRTAYALGYSYSKKAPLWVAYKLTKESVEPNNGRGGDPFEEDIDIPKQYRSTADDYNEPIYDRGHMAPRAALDFSPQSRDETFLYSNMTPQLPGFNQQGWRYLEAYIIQWATNRDEIYVVTGSIFGTESKTIGNDVYVPTAFYKVVFDPKENETIAFIMPHKKIYKREIPDFITSVDEVEKRTECDFNALLTDIREEEVESSVSSMW